MSSCPMTTPASSVPTTLPRLNEPMRSRPMTKPTASVRKIASSGLSLSADTKNAICDSLLRPRVLSGTFPFVLG